VTASAGSPPGPGPGAEPALPAGLLVEARYELKSWLGGGPLGAVYQAFDRDVEVEVALKLLSAPLLPAGVAAGQKVFSDSMRRVVKLVHPALIKVFDAGPVTKLEGAPLPAGASRPGAYVSMQLLAGLPLSRVMEVRLARQTRFEAPEAAGVLGEAGVALAAAQPLGPHGRLKPGNLVVLEQGLKLTDLGLAQALSAPGLAAAAAGDADAVYLSPEARLGAPLQPESDTYSLGLLALVLLGGKRPAVGASPSSTDVQALLSGLPAKVSELLGRALSPEPQKRPPPVAFLVDVLEQLDPARAERLRAQTAQLRAAERRFREASGPINLREGTPAAATPRRGLPGIAEREAREREARPATGSVTAPGAAPPPSALTPTGPPPTRQAPERKPLTPLRPPPQEDNGATVVAPPPELPEETDSSGDLLGGPSALSLGLDPGPALDSPFDDLVATQSGVGEVTPVTPSPAAVDLPTEKVPPESPVPAAAAAALAAAVPSVTPPLKSPPSRPGVPAGVVVAAPPLKSPPSRPGVAAGPAAAPAPAVPPTAVMPAATLPAAEPIPTLAELARALGSPAADADPTLDGHEVDASGLEVEAEPLPVGPVGPSGRVASAWPTVDSDGRGVPVAAPAATEREMPVALEPIVVPVASPASLTAPAAASAPPVAAAAAAQPVAAAPGGSFFGVSGPLPVVVMEPITESVAAMLPQAPLTTPGSSPGGKSAAPQAPATAAASAPAPGVAAGSAAPPPTAVGPAVMPPVSTAEMAAVVGVALPELQPPKKKRGGVPFVVMALLVFVVSLAIGAAVKMRLRSIGPQVERPSTAGAAPPPAADAGKPAVSPADAGAARR
jgi:serine/threonine-protein kinase